MKRILLATILILSFSNTLYADIKMTLSPPMTEISIAPGAVKTFPLMLTNNGEMEKELKLYPTDLILTKEGKTAFPEPGTSKYSCAKWLEVNPKKMTLKPNETKQIMCKLAIPKTESGGRYAAIMVEIAQPKDEPQKGQVVSYRLASLLLVTIKSWNLKNEAVIENIQLVPDQNAPGYEIIASIKNKGNVHLMAEGKAVLKNEQGYKLSGEPINLEAGKGTVFPEGIRDFKGKFEKSLADGVYIVETKVTYDKKKNVSKDVSKRKWFEVSGKNVKEIEQRATATTVVEKQISRLWIEPSTIDFTSVAGGMRSSSILVRNEVASELEIEAFKKDYSINQEGKICYLDQGTQSYSCADWIDLRPSKFILKPGQKRNIAFVMKIPKEAKGGKYAAIHFVGMKDKEVKAATELKVSAEILNTGIKKAELSDVSYYREKQKQYISFILANTGNVCILPKSEIKIYQKKESIAQIPILEEQEAVLPGEKRKITVPFEQKLEKGDYFVGVTIDYGAKEPIQKGTEFFVK